MSKLMGNYKGKPVLIVGENYPFHSCMINLISLNGKTVYEINEELISAQGLKPMDALKNGQSTSEIEWKKSLDRANADLLKQQQQLKQTQQKLNQSQQQVSQTKEQLAETDAALQNTADTLNQAKGVIEEKAKIISMKDHDLMMQEAEIANQRRINITIGIILVLAIALLFFIIRGFITSRRTNEKLMQMNKALKEHKDELFLQKLLIEEKNREIQDSIEYAKNIQTALMPSPSQLAHYFKESFLMYRPKDIVSGDFFWFTELNDSYIIAVVDCTGHGVPGAMMSVVGLKLLNQAVNEKGLTLPEAILEFIDEGVQESFSHNAEKTMRDGMDLALIKIFKKELVLEFAGVYNPLYVVNASGVKEIKPDKKAIGYKLKDFKYSRTSVQLQKNDCIYLFTDGFADQFGGPSGKKFKYAQFKSLLKSSWGDPLYKQEKLINEAFDSWKGALEQIDDVCVIGLRI